MGAISKLPVAELTAAAAIYDSSFALTGTFPRIVRDQNKVNYSGKTTGEYKMWLNMATPSSPRNGGYIFKELLGQAARR